MLIGTTFNQHFSRTISTMKAAAILAWICIAFAICSDKELNFSYFTALVLFFTCYWLREKIKGNRILDFFADISYPLYVFHAAFGYVGMRIMMGAGINALLALTLQTVTTVGIAFAIHKFVEAPSHKLGKNLSN